MLFICFGCDSTNRSVSIDTAGQESEPLEPASDSAIDNLKSIAADQHELVGKQFSAAEVLVDDEGYPIVIRFEDTGLLNINGQTIALGDPLDSWIVVLGEASRVTRNRGHIWDDLGITLDIDELSSGLEIVDQINISFADYYAEWPEKKDRYPDGPPHRAFTGLFRFGDGWIDRDRKVEEFLKYESTKTLKDSFDRSLVFRDIFINEDGNKVSFSITQGLSKAFPEGPDNITASIIR